MSQTPNARIAETPTFPPCLRGLLVLGLLVAGGAVAREAEPVPCVIEDGNPGTGGRFEAVVSNAEDAAVELAGFATSSSGPGGRGWSVQVLTPGGANSILLLTEASGRPAPGSYRIVDWVGTDATPPQGQFVGSVALEGDVLGASGFFTVKGTLTIMSSSPSSVAGCFEFSAADMRRTSSVSVSGKFVSGNQGG